MLPFVQNLFRNYWSFLWLFLTLPLVTQCAGSPESPGAGSCSLKCNSPRVASAQSGVVRLMGTEAINISCVMTGNTVAEPLNGPVQVRFLVFENRGPFTRVPSANSSGGSGSGGGGGGTTLSGASNLLGVPPGAETGSSETDFVPLAGIGFEPMIVGTTAAEKTQEGYDPNTGEVTPFKFAGVVTPRSEWCTDSCGVATYEVWPLCIRNQSNPVAAGVLVHGVSNISTYQVTTTHADPTQTALTE